MRNLLKDREVKQRRDPKNDVENDRAEKLREDDLPVAHWCSHERFDRAELKLLRKKPHGNERKNQNEGEPEENRIEKARVLVADHLQFDTPTTGTIVGDWFYFIANSQLFNYENKKNMVKFSR